MKRKPCPYCGAKGTNKGYLKHYGKYHGFACRTWTTDETGAEERSQQCRLNEIENKLRSELQPQA